MRETKKKKTKQRERVSDLMLIYCHKRHGNVLHIRMPASGNEVT